MTEYLLPVQIRWSDLDPNLHLRHSVYYDWGAYCRIEFLNAQGLTTQFMHQLKIGPIIFREESVFKKEIVSGDEIKISLMMAKSRKNFSRWTMQHHIIKNENLLCAILTIDGAWMDIEARKLTIPPPKVVEVFELIPKTEDFSWL